MAKKRRTWSIIALCALIITVAVFFLDYENTQRDIQATQASIDYSIDTQGSTRFYTFGSSAININCRNGGGMDGTFYLVVKFINASFSDETPMPYTKVDGTLIKTPFLLHKSGASMDSNSKNIFFTIDEGVGGFSIAVTLEKYDQNPLKPNPIYPTTVEYGWNEEYSCYMQLENKG